MDKCGENRQSARRNPITTLSAVKIDIKFCVRYIAKNQCKTKDAHALKQEFCAILGFI